jgi:adenylate cyclase
MKQFLFLFLLSTHFLFAQKPPLDSLKNVLLTAKDTNKVNILNELAKFSANSNPLQAEKYAQEALENAQKIGYKKGEAQGYNALGLFKINKRLFKDAYEYHNLALKIREELNDKKGVSVSFNNLGSLFVAQSNYSSAMEYYLKALKIREEMKDEKGQLSTLNNMGAVFMNQASEKQSDTLAYKQAIGFFEKALAISKKIKDRRNEAVLLNNIGEIYKRVKKNTQAIDCYLKSIVIREEIKDNFQLPASYNSLGDVYYNLKDYKKAFDYQTKAKELAIKIDNKQMIVESGYGLARIAITNQELDKALQEAQAGLELSQKTDFKQGIIEGRELLAEIYEKKQDYKNAFYYKVNAHHLKDSLFNEQNSKILSGKESAYQLEQRDNQIKLRDANIARQNLFNYALILGLGLVFILAFVLFRGQQAQKKANKEISSEKAKSDNLLLNILPEKVAQELKEKGYATAQRYDMASVLFTDFQGFTKRTALMTPEQVIAELNLCFSKFDEIIKKYNLEKIKTIGDAYMCAGGLPIANQTNPIDAIKAGLEMQKYMQIYKEECIAKGEEYFQCRLGINTGKVVAGVVGTSKFAYDIWGDAVNTASRAESSGEVGKVNITEATYELVKDVFECQYRGELELKGKGLVKMYFVVSPKEL